MTSLRETQQALLRAILFDETATAEQLIAKGSITPASRIAIYRNNAREGFSKALELTFPALLKLSGADWFRQTACAYWREYPSTHGDLHYAGAHLPQFLQRTLHATEHSYFADVAQLEWAYHQVLAAAEEDILDPQQLAGVPAAEHGAISFQLRSTVRLMMSAFPVFAIWNANRPDTTLMDTEIRLDTGPSRVLLVRRVDHVEVREVTANVFELLHAFTNRSTLDAACNAVLAHDPNFDLAATLTQLMQLGVFAGFSLRASS
jgi:hypothetical protein